jgi:biotin transport system ATP-binding protein
LSDSICPAAALETIELGYRFADGAWAFRSVGLALAPGRIAVLAGRNGAGKSLLARNLAGLLEPSEGQVLLGGRTLAALGGQLAAKIGYLSQDARLQVIGDTVLDDVLFGPRNLGLPEREALERARSSLEACGLSGKESSYTYSLSGGELRRLAIAGLLALGPSVAVLDEPFANLDPEGVRSVLHIIRDAAASGMALLVVTHELEKILGLASSFFVMSGGGIALEGSPAEVLAAGIEAYGLRDPLRPTRSLAELQWLE